MPQANAEIDALKARVRELEQVLAAKPPTDLPGLRRMMDLAPWGVLVVEADRRITYANLAMTPWLRAPPPAIGLELADVLAPELLDFLRPQIPLSLAGEIQKIQSRLRHSSGQARNVDVVIAPRTEGPAGITGVVVAIYDTTETQALDQTIRENEAHLSKVSAVSPSVLYIYDFALGHAVWIGGRQGSVMGYTAEELADRNRPPLTEDVIHAEDLPRVQARMQQLLEAGDDEVREVEYRIIRKDGSQRWVLDRGVVFERGEDGLATKILCAAVNIDERKRAEEQRTLLLNELNHRVKNTLTTVLSLIRQTLTKDRSIDDARATLTDRLMALSDSQNVLTEGGWRSADLKRLIGNALRPFQAPGAPITAEGPNAQVSSQVALGLAMALHELGTNAVKHGALSVPSGRVDLSWRILGDGEQRLELTWREREGPAVSPPERDGFGTRLLTRGLRTQLDGGVRLEFAPEGLVCRIEAPLEGDPVPPR